MFQTPGNVTYLRIPPLDAQSYYSSPRFEWMRFFSRFMSDSTFGRSGWELVTFRAHHCNSRDMRTGCSSTRAEETTVFRTFGVSTIAMRVPLGPSVNTITAWIGPGEQLSSQIVFFFHWTS